MKKLPKFNDTINEQSINESNVYKVYGREQHVDDNATMDLVWMISLHNAYQEVFASPEFRSWLKSIITGGYDADLWYDTHEAPSSGVNMDGRNVQLRDIIFPTLYIHHGAGELKEVYTTTYNGRYKISITVELFEDGWGTVYPTWAAS